MNKVFKINIVCEVSRDNILNFESDLDLLLNNYGKKLSYKYLPNTDYLKGNPTFERLKKSKRTAGWNLDTFINDNANPEEE